MTGTVDRTTAERCEALLLRLERESRDALEALQRGDLQRFGALLHARDVLVADLGPLLEELRATARGATGRARAPARRTARLLTAVSRAEAELLAEVKVSRDTVVEELGSIRRRSAGRARYAPMSPPPRSRIDLTR